MPKEKSINPAQAQRKADKAKAIKKGKAEALTRRNEKLAKRNPERLQKQLDDLKAIESSGGKLTSHEKTLLESLEKDLKAVKKAREALGDAALKFGAGSGRTGGEREGRGGFGDGRGGRGRGVLGKRRRGDEDASSEDDPDIPDDVKRIPMPRDTPPPFPKEILDKWYQKRRERMAQERERRGGGTNANSTPLGRGGRFADRRNESDGGTAPTPVLEAKTVYEAKPIVRDLRKEAVAFVPAVVRKKLEKGKGVGGLVEPEEADRLEREGYMATKGNGDGGAGGDEAEHTHVVSSGGPRAVVMEDVEDEDG